MVLNAFTAFHVVLSLVGIGSGVVAVDRSDNREPFDLSPPSPGDLAPDLCHHRRDGALFQRFRAGRPALSPRSGTKGRGADPVGAAFPDSADRLAASVRGDWNSRRDRKAATRACPVIHNASRSFS